MFPTKSAMLKKSAKKLRIQQGVRSISLLD
jgi:hypothetical protein